MRRTDSNPPSLSFIAENPFISVMLKMSMDEETADVAFEFEDGDGDQQGQTAQQSLKMPHVKFHEHKFISKQCAPVLPELCTSDEGLTSIPISGIEPEIFRVVLYYVYGGKPTEADFKSHAKEVIDAADRFGIVNLRLEAEVWYVKTATIDVGNVVVLFLYADAMNCALLKETVMDFIVGNGNDVLQKAAL